MKTVTLDYNEYEEMKNKILDINDEIEQEINSRLAEERELLNSRENEVEKSMQVINDFIDSHTEFNFPIVKEKLSELINPSRVDDYIKRRYKYVDYDYMQKLSSDLKTEVNRAINGYFHYAKRNKKVERVITDVNEKWILSNMSNSIRKDLIEKEYKDIVEEKERSLDYYSRAKEKAEVQLLDYSKQIDDLTETASRKDEELNKIKYAIDNYNNQIAIFRLMNKIKLPELEKLNK